MTDLLYLDDSYVTEFTGRVVDCSETGVILDRTIFYPRGGGQMGDIGIINGPSSTLSVLGTERREGEVWHIVDQPALKPGDDVHCAINWDHRYQQMRTHTALHILCGVIFRRFRASVTGCQMYADRARMDFTLGDLSPARLREIEALSNEAVKSGHAVRSRWVSRAEAERIPDLIRTRVSLLPPDMDPIRIVEIADLDLQADGGTHVNNTFEVGGITITKWENKGSANKRIEIVIPEAVSY
jgi:misacylated tRNA(Ala) deacylase